MRCKAVTHSRTRCSRTALPVNQYCWQHQAKKTYSVFALIGALIGAVLTGVGFWADMAGLGAAVPVLSSSAGLSEDVVITANSALWLPACRERYIPPNVSVDDIQSVISSNSSDKEFFSWAVVGRHRIKTVLTLSASEGFSIPLSESAYFQIESYEDTPIEIRSLKPCLPSPPGAGVGGAQMIYDYSTASLDPFQSFQELVLELDANQILQIESGKSETVAFPVTCVRSGVYTYSITLPYYIGEAEKHVSIVSEGKIYCPTLVSSIENHGAYISLIPQARSYEQQFAGTGENQSQLGAGGMGGMVPLYNVSSDAISGTYLFDATEDFLACAELDPVIEKFLPIADSSMRAWMPAATPAFGVAILVNDIKTFCPGIKP